MGKVKEKVKVTLKQKGELLIFLVKLERFVGITQ
jgi:hypothetical protein